MKPYQKKLIELSLQYQALKFGRFTLKSGRQSPYFFNAGLFRTAQALKILGECYKEAILDNQLKYTMLFGPAYKGIPLVSATAIALAEHQPHLPYAFNRKEAKDHGEGGQVIGAPLEGDVLIVDDVITAGTAIRESIQLIHQNSARVHGVVVALDRQEKGQQNLSAIQELNQTHHVPVYAILRLDDIISYVKDHDTLKDNLPKMLEYRQTFGIPQ